MTPPKRRPGDVLLDRYFPDADYETRERAREAFREYARVLGEFGRSIRTQNRDSRESDLEGKIPSLNDEI